MLADTRRTNQCGQVEHAVVQRECPFQGLRLHSVGLKLLRDTPLLHGVQSILSDVIVFGEDRITSDLSVVPTAVIVLRAAPSPPILLVRNQWP